MSKQYTDILYERRDGVALITINRPEVLNAFRAETIDDLIEGLHEATDDRGIGVVVITGAGDRAFCVGGDQKARGSGGYGSRHRGVGMNVDLLNSTIRSIPKPVIAAVNGYAIGGGNVLQVLCDLSIASDNAVFGQVGPKVGSVDAGFGTAYLARLVGERKAREIWYLCRRYTAQQALEMGLINEVVPKGELMAEVFRWCEEILQKSPTALQLAKNSFNVDTEMIAGMSRFALNALELYYETEESLEGTKAFLEKRPPDFSRFRR